jgi:glutamate/tyrosine decarboxylase-like PLP-dependent enzyme
VASEADVLRRACEHAIAHLEGLEDDPVDARAEGPELRAALGGPLPARGEPAERVIDHLVTATAGGLVGTPGGRFFGWVIGGTLPAAVGADWLTSAWDQNAGIFAASPAEAVIEEVAGAWVKELLGLPAEASFALVTGCQMAHVTCLAAARGAVLADAGWAVEQRGLAGAPPVRVLAGELRHVTIDRALRLLGLGTDALTPVDCEPGGAISPARLERALSAGDGPAIVCLQAGELNTGAFDPFPEAIAICRRHGAWVHVDGAFGLWAAATPALAHLTAGVDGADSWATDAHKWLNVPYDCGIAVVARPEAHRAAFTADASYLIRDAEDERDQVDWNPEFSRRGRGIAVYAAIRSLGREGVAELVEGCCRHAADLVAGIGALPGAEVVSAPVVNQGLVRFLDPGGDHDRRTDEVAARVRADGEAWFGCVAWRGRRVMRVSVCSWRTDADDVARAVAAVERALEQTAGADAAGGSGGT